MQKAAVKGQLERNEIFPRMARRNGDEILKKGQKKGTGWTYRSFGRAKCRSCDMNPSNKPTFTCSSEEHKKSYELSKFTSRDRGRQAYRFVHNEIIKKFGGKCKDCGINDIRILTINHINGGGSIERRNKSISVYYKEILLGNRTDIDIRCHNCNILYEYKCERRNSVII